MTDRDDIDELLRSAGAQWRSQSVGRPVTIDRSQLRPQRSRSDTTLGKAAALLGSIALGVIAVALIMSVPRQQGVASAPTPTSRATEAASAADGALPSNAPVGSPLASAPKPTAEATIAPSSLAPSPSASEYLVVDGDAVQADGFVAGSDERGLRICKSIGGPQLLPGQVEPSTAPGEGPLCPPLSVPLANISVADLPSWVPLSWGGRSEYVSLTGTWSDGRFVVARITESNRPIETDPPLPDDCVTPEGGWPGDIPNNTDGEAALRMLSEELSRDANTYLNYWRADLVPSNPDAEKVTVVGTVDDPASVTPQLRSLFPYNLCVMNVAFPNATLESVSRRLTENDGTWRTSIDVALDRVVVRLGIVDANALARIGDDVSVVTIEPLVRPVG
jgi:hypothetical protein